MLKSLICSKPKDRINSCLDANGYGSFTIMATFQDITEILNNRDINNFQTPEFQADLDEDKIQQMVDSFRSCKSHFLSQLLLTVAHVKFGNDEINYIMDGQHRMEMIKILHEKYKENMHVILAIHIVNNEDTLKQLFDTLNKDSTKNLNYVKLPIFKKQVVDEVRKALSLKFAGCYEKKKKQTSHIMTINEFVEQLELNGFFSSFENLAVSEIIEKIENNHAFFINYVGYLEHVCKPKSTYYKDEETMIKQYSNVIFFRNNNFVQFLCTSDDPEHYSTKNLRVKISGNLREKVWQNHYGKKTSGVCPITGCAHIMSSIDKHGFQCGHIQSVKNGGSNDLSNLRPICADCNSKMGSTNWNEFVTSQELKLMTTNKNLHEMLFDKLLSEKLEEDIENDEPHMIDCYICTKYITKHNSQLMNVDGNNRLVCSKCFTHYKNNLDFVK